MHDYIQSVEHLEDGRVRVVGVLPFESFAEVLLLIEYLVHGARFLSARSRVSRASSLNKVNVVNKDLVNVR